MGPRNRGPDGGNHMRNLAAVLAVTACLTPASGALAPVNALGALAVGETAGGVAKDGVAMGTAWNYSSQDEANSAALKNCHDYKPAPQAAKECKLVGTLNAKQCYAIAMDPKAGTPGVGWAIADDKPTAQSQALANCKVTAGVEREQYCAIAESNCDGQKNDGQK